MSQMLTFQNKTATLLLKMWSNTIAQQFNTTIYVQIHLLFEIQNFTFLFLKIYFHFIPLPYYPNAIYFYAQHKKYMEI